MMVGNGIPSPDTNAKRKDSQSYWKEKAEGYRKQCISMKRMIGDLHEKSIDLTEIPNLLTVQKVKPKNPGKATTRVTQVHGSMEGKDVLELVKSISEEKGRKLMEKEQRRDKKGKKKKHSTVAKIAVYVTMLPVMQ